MHAATATDLYLIRHAPVTEPGIMAGRRDVAADTSDSAAAAAAAAYCGTPDHLVTSPAQRCRATAEAIWPGQEPQITEAFWEQDFGEWEGMAYADLPDLGPLAPYDLAAHRAKGGESFFQVADRIAPALRDLSAREGKVALVAHAGVIRATLGLALTSVEAGLSFAVSNWSVTHLRSLGGGPWAIMRVNWGPAHGG